MEETKAELVRTKNHFFEVFLSVSNVGTIG
jgi:hypothetical protein